MTSWWPASAIAAGLGVPGYAQNHSYNYIVLAFWLTGGPADSATVWANPVMYMGTDSVFGKTTSEIQINLKKLYNNAGIKIMVSAFGATENPTSQDPAGVATKLANFVNSNNLDGVDIDYEDNAAMEAGRAEQWLITFTKTLRSLLPNHIISHAPQAPYFKKEYYSQGAYVTVNSQVGNLIDFYNVQFYNQGDTQYNTYSELFVKANGFFSGTSVSEIINRGIPSNKIVVGGDASNTGLVSATDLGNWCSQAFTQFGWYAGVFFWQFRSDMNGALIKSATSQLLSKVQGGLPVEIASPTTNTSTTNTTTNTTKNTTTTNTTTTNTTKPATNTTTNTTTTNTTLNTTKPTTNTTTNTSTTNTSTTNTSTSTTTNTTVKPASPSSALSSRVSYPVRLVYVDFINIWWPATAIAAAIGVPGYAKKSLYNYVVFAFWNSIGPVDIANIWAKPTYYFGTDSVFGATDADIRTNLKRLYNQAGIRILVSAFGANEFPTDKDPTQTATALAQFVTDYGLDGCDIDFEDNAAMESGKA